MKKINFKTSRKATEMSFNTIIVAILAVIVLIILVMIFSGKMSKTGEETNRLEKEYSKDKCEIPGTTRLCRVADECRRAGGFVYPETDCSAQGLVCCSQ